MYDIDDLKEVVNTNIQERAREIPKVETIITNEMEEFLKWYSTRDVVPTIVMLTRQMEEIRQKEFNKVIGKLKNINENEKNLINAMSKAIINKIMHKPIIKLKKASTEDNGYIYANFLKDLFELKEENGISDENINIDNIENENSDCTLDKNELDTKGET